MPNKITTTEEQITRAKNMVEDAGKKEPIMGLLTSMIHEITIKSFCTCLEELGVSPKTLSIASIRVSQLGFDHSTGGD